MLGFWLTPRFISVNSSGPRAALREGLRGRGARLAGARLTGARLAGGVLEPLTGEAAEAGAQVEGQARALTVNGRGVSSAWHGHGCAASTEGNKAEPRGSETKRFGGIVSI